MLLTPTNSGWAVAARKILRGWKTLREAIKSAWGVIAKNEKQITTILACVAGLYAVFQYLDAVERAQVAESVKLTNGSTERLSTGPYSRLKTFWATREMQEWIAEQKAENDATRRRENYYKNLPDKMNESAKSDVYDIMVFYRSIGYCTTFDICHPKVICRYFFDEIQAFREQFRPVIDKFDEGGLQKGVVKELVEVRCKEAFFNYCHAPETSGSPYCQKL